MVPVAQGLRSTIYAQVAAKLRIRYPSIFGHLAEGNRWTNSENGDKGIARQQVRFVVFQHSNAANGTAVDGRGRNDAVPLEVTALMIKACNSVVSTRAIQWSAALLQPIALAVLIHEGYGHLLRDPEQRKRGLFCLSRGWLTAHLKFKKWRAKGSYGDARKLPEDWRQQGIDMRDRVAILVYKYKIPEELVINVDHTSFQHQPNAANKGSRKSWHTPSQIAEGDTSVQGGGNKAAVTGVVGCHAGGGLLPTSLVFQGKTQDSLPHFSHDPTVPKRKRIDDVVYVEYHRAFNNKCTSQQSVCFDVMDHGDVVRGVGSVAVTSNHWADPVTSRGYVPLDVIRYIEKAIMVIRSKKGNAGCQAFGVQRAILLVDVWYGWLDADFREWLSVTYPWILLVFVPARCTHKFQPCDLGVIRACKAKMLQHYEQWAVKIVMAALKSGVKAADVLLPMDVQTLKHLLMESAGKCQVTVSQHCIESAWQKSGANLP